MLWDRHHESFPSFRLSPALLICAKGVWGKGKTPKRSNLAFRSPDPTAGGLAPAGLQNRHDEGSVLMRFRGAASGAVEAVWDGRWQIYKHVGSRSWVCGGRARSASL